MQPHVMHPPISGRSGRVRWHFTDRAGGHSLPPYESFNLAAHVGDAPDRVELNRSVLVRVVGAQCLATMRPNHGTGVAIVEGAGDSTDVDALVTTTGGVGLLALGADCIPAVLFDEAAGVIAAVHCGWLGLRDDVFGATLDQMRSHGAGRITAILGPAICGGCYAVPPQRAGELAAEHPGAVGLARDGQPSIDIRVGSIARLQRTDVEVHLIGGCTAETATLFSHRRDGLTGRHGAIVLLESQ